MYNTSNYIQSIFAFFFFSSRRRHTRFKCDWSSDVCSSDLVATPRLLPNLKSGLQLKPNSSSKGYLPSFVATAQISARVSKCAGTQPRTNRNTNVLGWVPAHLLTLRSEEHTSELQSHLNLVCRLLLEKKNT